MTPDEAAGTEEHAAPREDWNAIAEGYDRCVAPQEVELANEALRLAGSSPANGLRLDRQHHVRICSDFEDD